MELKLFGFIHDVTNYIENITDDLEMASNEIKKIFLKELLELSNDGYLNINRRVKSVPSLKEKKFLGIIPTRNLILQKNLFLTYQI